MRFSNKSWQAGWIPFASPKNNLPRITLLVLAVQFAFLYWKFPHQLQQFRIIRILHQIIQAQPYRTASVLALIYFLLYSSVGVVRHLALQTRAFDLGIFAQAIWNTTQGDWLFSSLKANTNLLGDHFSPLLILIAPLYSVVPSPMTLLVLQAFAAAANFFFIAKIAYQKTGSRFFTFALLIIYSFYLPTRGALHEDFHPEVLVEPFLFMAFLSLESRKVVSFLASLAVVVSAKENMWLIAFAMGFYAFAIQKRRALGLSVMLLSTALLLLEIKVIIPLLGNGRYLYNGFYQYLWTGGPAAWLTPLGPETWAYLLKVFAPFLFLPLFHLPTAMLAAPILVQNILSVNPVFRSFGYHYTIGMTPFLFISAAYGFETLLKRFPKVQNFKPVLIFLMLMTALFRSGTSEYTFFYKNLPWINLETRKIRSQLALIPAEAIVLTHNSVIPQVCHRKHVYQFEYNAGLSKLEEAKKHQADYVIFYERWWEPGLHSLQETLEDFRRDGTYEAVYGQDDFQIWRKIL